MGSWASLLSGSSSNLGTCQNATDPSCVGGVAAVLALVRDTQRSRVVNGTNETAFDLSAEEQLPATVLQRLDKENPFSHMHPLQWNVNRLVIHQIMKLNVFVSPPSVLLQHKDDYSVSPNDISLLQTLDMPLLLTNVEVPPTATWHPYQKAVHFDPETNLAILSISNSGEPLNVPQIASANRILDFITKRNYQAGCLDPHASNSSFAEQQRIYDFYFKGDDTTPDTEVDENRCWVPVVYYTDVSWKAGEFLEAMLARQYPPALIIDGEGTFPSFPVNATVPVEEDEDAVPVPYQYENGMWIVSYLMNSGTYYQHLLTIDDETGTRLKNVELVTRPLSHLPDSAKDKTYKEHIQKLRVLADEALRNNPILGYSEEMSYARDGLTTLRPCKAGECPLGNLFTEALRWKADADISFITSGGIRGVGWPAGPVRISNVWETLPFPNTICTGYMSGVSLYKLLAYSFGIATFELEDTRRGGRLLQIAGMRVTYNTKIDPPLLDEEDSSSRLIAIDIWDDVETKYKPIERLKLYKFATDSFLCGGYPPFPSLLGSDLVIQGEKAGTTSHVLVQTIVGEFLSSQYGSPEAIYPTSLRDRMRNDTLAFDTMDLVQRETDCVPGTYWADNLKTCLNCPVNNAVQFSRSEVEIDGFVSGASALSETSILLSNRESFRVAVVPKSVPPWIQFKSSPNNFIAERIPLTLNPDESIELDFVIDASTLEEGTARAAVAFGVLDGGAYPGCVGQDATFEIFARVSPNTQQNHIGNFRAVGLSLMGVAMITTLFFGGWVFFHRQIRIVKTMQPIFLIAICVGVFIMSAAMAPLSIDDDIASTRGCDIACMATPWLLSMGFTITMSALFSKLWRINRLFANGLRRIQLREKDVIAPFIVLFTSNFVLLLTWTLVDPLTWSRLPVDDQEWNTYGTCLRYEGTTSTVMIVLVAVVNIGALLLASWQAWKARKISDEFSESKNLGIALFSWVQLFVVGFPVLFLIDNDNTTAKYFLQIGLLFAVCMSMILIIFVPILRQKRKAATRAANRNTVRPGIGIVSGDSGVSAIYESSHLGDNIGKGYVRVSGLHVEAAAVQNTDRTESGRVSGFTLTEVPEGENREKRGEVSGSSPIVFEEGAEETRDMQGYAQANGEVDRGSPPHQSGSTSASGESSPSLNDVSGQTESSGEAMNNEDCENANKGTSGT